MSLTWTMPPKCNGMAITSWELARTSPISTRSTLECFCAALHSSTGLKRQRKAETARCRTACASWRKMGNLGLLILAMDTGRTSTARRLWHTPKRSLTKNSPETGRRRALFMLRIPPKARVPLRILAALLSSSLLAYLIWQAGPSKLWENVVKLGWGFMWVLALAGVSAGGRALAWRLMLDGHKHKISFPRLFGLRLGAEATGQLGIVGQTFGDSIRVSQLGVEIPMANGLASVK